MTNKVVGATSTGGLCYLILPFFVRIQCRIATTWNCVRLFY